MLSQEPALVNTTTVMVSAACAGEIACQSLNSCCDSLHTKLGTATFGNTMQGPCWCACLQHFASQSTILHRDSQCLVYGLQTCCTEGMSSAAQFANRDGMHCFDYPCRHLPLPRSDAESKQKHEAAIEAVLHEMDIDIVVLAR